jgi:hypothetical protein
VEGTGEGVRVELEGSGLGELRLELRLPRGQLVEFVGDLAEALAACLFGQGAALERLQVAVACSRQLAVPAVDPVGFGLERGLTAGGELARALERFLEQPGVGEAAGEDGEQLLFELVGGDAFAVAALRLAVPVAAEAGV